MKCNFGSRLLAMILAFCLILAMVPVGMPVEAEAVSGISSLTCSSFISNSEHQHYIDTMMKYYLNNNSKLTTALDNGKSVIFMFEGGSDNYPSNGYADVAYGDVRTQAVCIVVQKNSSGNAAIVFSCEDCSSIPDDPDNCTGTAYSGATTIADGIYGVQTTNHTGPYGALNTYATQGYYTPPADQDGYFNGANGINIHTRTTATSGYGWSLGCQVIGYGNSSANAFNAFMKAVVGITYNVWVSYSSALYTLSGSNLYRDVGYYVVDRQLGTVNSSGVKYGSGSLIEMYNSTALTNITEWSTAARKAAGVDDYASGCESYPAYCTVKTNQSTPINTQPCAVSTANNSSTIETAAAGATYTATGIYRNTADNLWYKVTTSSGKTGYLYAGHSTYVKQLTSDITLSGASYPNGHVAGGSFVVSGTISSIGNQITTAAVYCHSGFGTSGTKVIGSSATVNSKSYALAGSTIDANTLFGDLTTGKYTYAIYASYKNCYASDATTLQTNTGTLTLMSKYFVVVSSSVTQSSCSHSNTTTTVKAATCTSSGTSVTSCSTCGLVTENTVAATGHAYGSWTTKAATCTTAGSKSRTCSNCGNVQTETIAALGHSYTLKTHAATCSSYAIYEYTCSTCGDNYKLNAGDLASGWIDYLPAGLDASLFNSKTQYRYSDYQTTTSYATSLSGYTVKSSEWVQSSTKTVNYVDSWPSGFSTSSSNYSTYNKKSSKVSASETATTKVEVNSDAVVGYLYYHWCYASSYYSQATSSGSYTTFHSYYSTTAPSNYTCDTSDMSYNTSNTSCCTNSNWYFVAEVYSQKSTTYNKLFTYERWTDFTAWSDTAATASSTRKVETRTVYQLKNASLGTHSYSNGVCTGCGIGCSHTWSNGTCSKCGYVCGHSYVNGTCSTCKKVCTHNYVNGACTVCKKACTHSWSGGTCTVCKLACVHNYSGGFCTVCGEASPVKDYYLFGYINGADYACESDYSNLGVYKFVDGQLITQFDSDSYVGVKTSDNLNWYMTQGWLGTDATTAVLYNTNLQFTNADKLFVPGGVEVTFTLVVNADDTLTLSYTVKEEEVVIPTLRPKLPSVSFEGEIFYNIYYLVDNIGTVGLSDMGLITWVNAPADGTIDNADAIIPGATYDGTYYCVHSEGVPAKNLADTMYFKVYAKLSDGTYAYSKMYTYSAKTYALDRLANSTNAKLKSLCVAMLNYGAAAQTHFGYKSYSLMNASLTADQKALVADYSSDMIASLGTVNSSKIGSFARNKEAYSSRYAAVSFDGAFSIKYYFTPSYTVSGNMTLYYWSVEDYNNASVLTAENATGKVIMTDTGTGQYTGLVEDIAAKEIDTTVYVAGVYTSGGVSYATGVLAYSIGAYCLDRIANGTDTMKTLATATAVYGYYAKTYFADA